MAKRYRMIADVIFYWTGPDGRSFQAEGATRDISVDGVFVFTATCPPVNAKTRMEVILPLGGAASKAQMRAEMTVLRVEHDIAGKAKSGFSAGGNGFLLRTFSERASRLVSGLIKQSEKSADHKIHHKIQEHNK